MMDTMTDILTPVLASDKVWQEIKGQFHLSGGQTQTMREYCQGLCTKRIAKSQGISIKTVEGQRLAIYQKMNVTDMWEATRRVMGIAVEIGKREGLL